MGAAVILYYFPNAAGANTALFGSVLNAIPDRMRPRFDAGNTRTFGDTNGPDGGRGLIATWQQDVDVAYNAATQRWQKCGDHWRGVRLDYQPPEFAKDSPPAEGYPVRMADGKQWVIPVALADAPHYDIPWREGIDEGGLLTREVASEYAAVCKGADAIWAAMNSEGGLLIDEGELRVACVTALQVNYRLDLEDCLVLGLFSSESYRDICRAILDMPELEQMLKKKRAAESAMNSGAAGCSDTTAQPGLTLL